MGGLFVGLLFVVGFFLAILQQDHVPPPPAPKKDPQLTHLEKDIEDCSRLRGVAILDPRSGYLGCNLPVREVAKRK